jgi:hypothetical protein
MVEGEPEFAVQMADYSYGTSNPALVGDFANEIVADNAPQLWLVRCMVGLDKWEWTLGQIVEITYPRYDFDDGRNARIVGISTDWLGGTIGLTLLFQHVPGDP